MSMISPIISFPDRSNNCDSKAGDPFYPASKESIVREIITHTDLLPPLAGIVANYLTPNDSDAETKRLIDELSARIRDAYEGAVAPNRRGQEREQREICAKLFFEQLVHLTRSQFERMMNEGSKSDGPVDFRNPSYYTPGYIVIGSAYFTYKVDYIKHEAFSWAIDHPSHPLVQPLRDSFQYLLDYCNKNCRASAETVAAILCEFYNSEGENDFSFIGSRMPAVCRLLAGSFALPRKSNKTLFQALINSGAIKIPEDLWERGSQKVGYD